MADRRIPSFSGVPRRVPLRTLLAVLLGGFSTRIGWVSLTIGLAVGWTFARHADYSAPVFALLRKETANGVVLEVRETRATEGGSDDTPGRRIYQIRYAFVAQGREREGVSYTSWDPPSPGQRVTVEYLASDASLSRIRGMRRAVFGPFAALALIFPLLGVWPLVHGLREGIQGCWLLRRGRLARARLKDIRPTNVSINNRPVMALTFEFRAQDGMDYQIVAKSHQPERLEDEAEEVVLYDATDPARAAMLDAMPGPPALGEGGEVLASPWRRVMWALGLPVLSAIGAGLFLAAW